MLTMLRYFCLGLCLAYLQPPVLVRDWIQFEKPEVLNYDIEDVTEGTRGLFKLMKLK